MAEIFKDFTDEAAELMRKADDGDAEAQYDFATYLLKEPDYSYRKDLSPDDVARGFRYLGLSAAQGYKQGIAALVLGDAYFRGEIVRRDYDKAKLWYNTALLKNNPPAAYMLGECAYYGYGCGVSYEVAAKLYLQAAPSFIDALIRIGDMCLRGEYFAQDKSLAKILFEHVLDAEERLYEKYEFYSDAHGQVRQRLDELERNDNAYSAINVEATAEQETLKEEILKIIADKG